MFSVWSCPLHLVPAVAPVRSRSGILFFRLGLRLGYGEPVWSILFPGTRRISIFLSGLAFHAHEPYHATILVERGARWLRFGDQPAPDAVGRVAVGDLRLHRWRVVRGQRGVTGVFQLTQRVTGIWQLTLRVTGTVGRARGRGKRHYSDRPKIQRASCRHRKGS